MLGVCILGNTLAQRVVRVQIFMPITVKRLEFIKNDSKHTLTGGLKLSLRTSVTEAHRIFFAFLRTLTNVSVNVFGKKKEFL